MAKACVLLTFEGAGQTSIECLDSRIAFLRREFPPPMRRADAAAKGIGSISDLAFKLGAGEEFRLASIVEFVTRADKLKPLEKTVPRSSSASEMWSRWKPRPTPIK
jgi:hypothetical protein